MQSINNYSHVSQEQQKSMSRILSGSTSVVQTELHSLFETTKQRRQQHGYSRVLCFTEEIAPSISTRPRIRSSFSATNDCRVFKFLRRGMDGKHLMCFPYENAVFMIFLLRNVAWALTLLFTLIYFSSDFPGDLGLDQVSSTTLHCI